MPTLSEDRDAIRDLYSRYALYLRTDAVDEWMELFSHDPTFTGSGHDLTGRAELEENGRKWARQRVHRLIVSHVIDVDGDTATCQASVLVLMKRQVAMSGTTVDELRRIDGAWRIHHRAFTPDPK